KMTAAVVISRWYGSVTEASCIERERSRTPARPRLLSSFDRYWSALHRLLFSVETVGESTEQEGSHLASGHLPVGAELVIGRRVAAPGHICRRECVDVALEYGQIIVDEGVLVRRRQIQCPNYDCGHLT